MIYKFLSVDAKLKHYNAVIKPEILYAAECLNLIRTGAFDKYKEQKEF